MACACRAGAQTGHAGALCTRRRQRSKQDSVELAGARGAYLHAVLFTCGDIGSTTGRRDPGDGRRPREAAESVRPQLGAAIVLWRIVRWAPMFIYAFRANLSRLD